MVFAPPGRDFVASLLNFCSCTQDKFVMVVAPGHVYLPAIKILHRNKFLAPRLFVPRHCTSDRHQLCNRGETRGFDHTCTTTRVMLTKLCTWMAKSAPYPPFPAERNLLPKNLDRWSAGIASGNTTSLYCRG